MQVAHIPMWTNNLEDAAYSGATTSTRKFSRAAVRRCLYTLATLGMVYSPDGRSYELLPRVLTVGHAYLAVTQLAKTAQISLDNLSKSLSQSCSVATLDGDDVLYIARTAVNNLSALPEAELEAWLGRAKLIRYAQYSITTIARRDCVSAPPGICN